MLPLSPYLNHIYPYYLNRQTWQTIDLEQMMQIAAFDEGLHCLPPSSFMTRESVVQNLREQGIKGSDI